MSRRGLVAVMAVVVAGSIMATYYLTSSSASREAIEAARIYMEAVKNRDFETIFRYHGPSQKRRFLVMVKGGRETKDYMDSLYRDQKTSFENAHPPQNLTGAWGWMEKFLFIPSGRFEVAGVEMKKHEENVSLPLQNINVRYYGVVTIEATYPDRDRAARIGGRSIRSALFEMKMVHSSNIARTLRGRITTDRWLFDSISARDGSVEYW